MGGPPGAGDLRGNWGGEKAAVGRGAPGGPMLPTAPYWPCDLGQGASPLRPPLSILVMGSQQHRTPSSPWESRGGACRAERELTAQLVRSVGVSSLRSGASWGWHSLQNAALGFISQSGVYKTAIFHHCRTGSWSRVSVMGLSFREILCFSVPSCFQLRFSLWAVGLRGAVGPLGAQVRSHRKLPGKGS